MSYLTRSVANRGVHLQITPRPRNLGESREILRLLSQFGEIDYFKNLKYDGQGLGQANKALVIYKHEKGAKNCFMGSPVRFRMGKVKPGSRDREVQKETAKAAEGEVQKDDERGPRTDAWGLGASAVKKGPLSTPFGLEPEPQRQRRYSSTTSYMPTPTPRPIRMPFDPPSPEDTTAQKSQEEDRLFHIHTSATFRNFRDQVNMGGYHSNFAIDSKMPGQADLATKVPVPGMSCVDWRPQQRPWRFVREERERGKRRERLGVLWEREGKQKVDAFGEPAKEGEKGRKWRMSWADVGIS